MSVDPAVAARVVAQRAASDFVRVMYGRDVADRDPSGVSECAPGVIVRYAVGVLAWRAAGVLAAPVVIFEVGPHGARTRITLVLHRDGEGWSVAEVET